MKSAAALLKANAAQTACRINPSLINNLRQESQGWLHTPGCPTSSDAREANTSAPVGQKESLLAVAADAAAAATAPGPIRWEGR